MNTIDYYYKQENLNERGISFFGYPLEDVLKQRTKILNSSFDPAEQNLNENNSFHRPKRSELQREKSFLQCHDKAPLHNSICTREFLKKNSMTTVLHPPVRLT